MNFKSVLDLDDIRTPSIFGDGDIVIDGSRLFVPLPLSPFFT
jgi:hypothetical protein